VVKVLVSKTGARLVIASDDHCPPHVHARHREEGWVVRLWFSFASNAAGVLDIAPTDAAVRQRQLNQMLDEVAANVNACRKIWWEGKTTTCLENKWLERAGPQEMTLLDRRQTGARQVRAARYDVQTCKTFLIFLDGTEDSIESGDAK